MKVVRLKKRIGRIRNTIYSKWVYDDGGAEPGEEVIIESYERETIGIGIYDGVGAVSVRILSRERIRPIREVIEDNILKAYQIRRRLGWDSYRLINSDADDLPGLIIDIYGDTAVIQSGSIGIDKYLDTIAKILDKHGIASKTYVRNDQRSRKEIGLEIWKDWIYGEGDIEVIITEGKAKFKVNIEVGHKTGFFLDQRMNRLEVRLYSRGGRVLDLFSYTGGFGIHSLLNGAYKVVFVEKDPTAIEYLNENLKLNKLMERHVEIVEDDVYRYIEERNMGYDLVVIDPNALIQKRTEYRRGVERYKYLYSETYKLLKPGGTAFLSSCSYFLKTDRYIKIVNELSPKPYIVGGLRGASPDHPYRVDTPELNYLKALYIYKSRGYTT